MQENIKFPKITLKSQQVHCRRNNCDIFQNLNFEITSGEILFVKGFNGSGKSSLLRMLAGLLKPYSGEFFLTDGTETISPFDPKGYFHFIGHQIGLKPIETVAESILAWTDLYGEKLEIGQALGPFELESLKHIQTKYLSEGQKRRVGLSRLFAIELPVWLLDEPNVGLDKDSLKSLYEAMDSHCKAGGLVVLTSHVEMESERIKTLDLAQYREAL